MSTYKSIFKATTLIGSTQAVLLLIGIIRIKVFALFWGPVGIGILGMYQSAIGLIGAFTNLGVPRAGVRQVAESYGSGQMLEAALSARSVRLLTTLTGIIGLLLVVLLCVPISVLTFDSKEYAIGIALLSVVLFFDSVTDGQKALLQGMRKLKDLAYCQILGALIGTAISVLLAYYFGLSSIVFCLIAVSIGGVFFSWFYSRKYFNKESCLSIKDLQPRMVNLIKTGFAFMYSGLIAAAVLYVSRILVSNELGLAYVGLYTAVSTLSLIYANMILNAIVADFYPKLTAISSDNVSVNKMVNEQVEMSLIMALPGIMATILLAPYVLEIFYSAEFLSATTVIRWQLLGVLLRVLTYPLAIILPAKGLSKSMIQAESISGFFHLTSLYFFMKLWGFEGVGLSFAFSCFFYLLVIMLIAKKSTGYILDKNCFRYFLISIIIMTISVVLLKLYDNYEVKIFVTLNLILISGICFLQLKKRLSGFF